MIEGTEGFPGFDRFELRGRLGAGGMGVVYQAYDRDREELVALKTIRGLEVSAFYRLKQEFRAIADLSHPNLVSHYELFASTEKCFFTMELIRGSDFLTSVCCGRATGATETVTFQPGHQADSSTSDTSRDDVAFDDSDDLRPLTEMQHCQVRLALVQLVDGLVALHEAGKLHRDIKPSNVLITPDDRLVLLDFGIATELESQVTGPNQRRAGTLGYMSLEQICGATLTTASDWYSVGALLYRTLTGRLPNPGRRAAKFHQPTSPPRAPAELIPSIPSDLNAVCQHLLQLEPGSRMCGSEILDRIGQTSGTDAPPLHIPGRRSNVRFVGRQQHLDAMQEAYRDAGGDMTAIVCLRGRSGLGKTSLLEQFLQLVSSDDSVVLGGRCYERESVPYKALDSLVESLCQHLQQLRPSQLARLIPSDAHALARVFPVLRRVRSFEVAKETASQIPDQQELRRRAFRALRELLTRLGEQTSLVLFIDDLQWGDVDSANLLADLLCSPHPPPLLFLACYRSEDTETSDFLKTFLAVREKSEETVRWHDLEVGELSPADAFDLAVSILDSDKARARELARQAVEESAGNPYFLIELLRDTARKGQSDELSSAKARSLDDVLQERLDALPPAARQLLDTIAVAGEPLAQEVAMQSAELNYAEEWQALAVLRAGHLVKTTGTGAQDPVETYHDRIKETVVDNLTPGRLLDRHRALAGALESWGRAEAVTLAQHHAGAGDLVRAGELYAVAAQESARALAFDRAATLYRRALDLLPLDAERERDFRTVLGDVLANAGRGAEAAQEYIAAADGATTAQRLELKRRAAMQSLISGHIDDGLEQLHQVLAATNMRMAKTPFRAFLNMLKLRGLLRVRGLGFRQRDASQVVAEQLTRVDVCWSAAVGLSIVDTIRGADFQARNLLLALKAGEPYRVSRALAWEAAHLSTVGRSTRVRADSVRSIAKQLAQELEHPHALGLVLLSAGIGAFMASEWRAAREMSEQAADLFRSKCTGVAWEIDTAQTFALWSLLFLGEISELCTRIPQVTKEAHERGNLYAATNCGTFAGHLSWLADDDPEGGRRDLREMMDQWSGQGFHVQHLTGLMGQTQTDLYSGAAVASWERLQRRWKSLRKAYFLRIQTVRIFMLHLRGRSALMAASQGESPARMLAAARRDIRRLQRERMTWASALAHLLQAGIASTQGRSSRARNHLANALAGFVDADMRLFAAVTRRRQGELMGGADGQALIQEADQWMHHQSIRNPAAMTDMHVPGFPIADGRPTGP